MKKERFEVEEFEDEEFFKMRRSSMKREKQQRCHTNWKRLWLDHPNDFEALDQFFPNRT